MKFEWDNQKEKINIKKHGIDFSIAARIFFDKNLMIRYDEEHSKYEDRYIAIGRVENTLLVLLVSYTIRSINEEVIRIISARPADDEERVSYYDNIH